MKNNINISIDDVSPHPKSSIKVLARCCELIDLFPDIKFTLFVPMAYTRLNEKSYYISQYPNFCNFLMGLSSNNFELGWHGYFHGIKNVSNNDEFKDLNFNDAIKIFDNMYKEADKCGVRHLFKSIFRPPAFKMSSEAILASKASLIDILALSLKDYAKKTYNGEENKHGKIVYYNINPPFLPLKLYNNMEIVYHACEWDKSYLDKEKTSDLIKFIKKEYDKIQFSFINKLC